MGDDWLRLPLLGPLLATILLQRGHLVFHASAVGIDGACTILVGEKGSGKSTLATALHARGNDFLSDDMVALDGSAWPMVLPAFPRAKLWPDAVELLNRDADQVPRIIAEMEKRDYRIERGFASRRLPLCAIFILSSGDAPAIEPLAPAEALYALIPHSYAARLSWDPNAAARARHFQQLAQLVRQVPVHRLKRPRRDGVIVELATLVEEYAQRHGGGARVGAGRTAKDGSE